MDATCSGFISAFLLAAGLASGPALAQSPALPQNVAKLGEFRDWTAYVAGKDANRVCYIVGEPIDGASDRAVRLAYVTHRPAKKAWSVVMIYPGTPYQDASQATVEIGRSQFALFTYRDTAWASDHDADAKLIKAMRAGKAMVVHGTDRTGAPIEDQYSLAGFIAAYRRIGEACNLK